MMFRYSEKPSSISSFLKAIALSGNTDAKLENYDVKREKENTAVKYVITPKGNAYFLAMAPTGETPLNYNTIGFYFPRGEVNRPMENCKCVWRYRFKHVSEKAIVQPIKPGLFLSRPLALADGVVARVASKH
jgi:hypothetical protein